MSQPLERAFQAMFKELAILLIAMEGNLDLLSYLVEGVLSGDDSDLMREEETFADTVDHVLYRAGMATIEVLDDLREQQPLLSRDQQANLMVNSQRYRDLVERWTALAEAVQHVWQLRKPCH